MCQSTSRVTGLPHLNSVHYPAHSHWLNRFCTWYPWLLDQYQAFFLKYLQWFKKVIHVILKSSWSQVTHTPLFLFNLAYANYTRGFHCDIYNMHMMCFDQIHPSIFLPLLSHLYFFYFNGFHYSAFIHEYKVVWLYSSPSPSPFILPIPTASPVWTWTLEQCRNC
jgi:hypothetical protein